MSDQHSIGEVGDQLGCQSWKIARLFELGVLPEPPRIAGRRIIPAAMIPQIRNALCDRGQLSAADAAPKRYGTS